MTEATLGFRIDSSQAAGASSDLDRLTASSEKAEQAANKVSLAASKASRGFADVSPALERIIAGLSRLETAANSIDQRLAAMARGVQSAATANRALADTTAAVQAAQTKETTAATQATAALERQRQAVERLGAASRRAMPAAANHNDLSEGNKRFIGRDIGFQLQDIAVTAAGGMSPRMIALQQGTQIAGAVQGLTLKQTGAALAGAFSGILSPVALASIAVTGLSAAAIQFFVNGADKAKSLDDVLKRSAETLDRIKDSYGDLAKTSASITSVAGNAFILSDARTQQIALDAAAEKERKNFLGSITDTSFASSFLGADSAKALQRLQSPQGDLKLFSGPIKSLVETAKQGKGGLKAFNDQVEELYSTLIKTSDDPQGLRAAADSVESIADAAFSASGKFKPFEDAMNRLRTGGDLSAFVYQVHQIGQEQGISKLADELLAMGDNAVKATQATENLHRILQTIDREDTRPGLRDRNDLAGYVNRRSATLRVSNGQFDADQQFARARTYAERNAAIEARVRSRATIDGDKDGGLQARVDRALEAERNRQNIEQRDARLQRSQSLDKALSDQQSEIDLIGKTGGAAVALRKEYELTSQIRLEAAQKGIAVDEEELNSIHERAKALGALQDQYNQSKFNFDINQQMSDARLSERDRQIVQTQRQYGLPENPNDANGQTIGKQLDWQDAKNTAKQFGSAFSNELISGSHNIGKAFLKGFQTSLENEAQKLWSKFFDSLGNVFADWITGSKGTAGTQATAASGIGSLAAKAIGGANDNKLPTGVPNTDIASYITQAAIKRGIDPTTALAVAKSEGGLSSWNQQSGVFKNGVQEPSFGPFQLYKGGGLGNAFQKQTGLDPAVAANGPAGVDFALDYAKKNGWGSWYGAKNTGISAWQGIGSNSNMNSAADAVNKLAENSKAAAASVGTFGNGLGQLGQSLGSNLFPAAPQASGGGGLFGLLGGLFSSPFKAMGPQGAAALAGTLKPGLFASGTNYAPGGPAIVGENGPELLDLPQGSQVTSNHKLMSALAANSNQPQPNRQLNVSIQGASGDDHVRTLVQQGVGAALNDYNTQQRRGGVGVLQARYSNQKV